MTPEERAIAILDAKRGDPYGCLVKRIVRESVDHIEVDLRGIQLAADLVLLSDIPGITGLDLDAEIAEEGLTHLVRLKELRHLRLWHMGPGVSIEKLEAALPKTRIVAVQRN